MTPEIKAQLNQKKRMFGTGDKEEVRRTKTALERNKKVVIESGLMNFCVVQYVRLCAPESLSTRRDAWPFHLVKTLERFTESSLTLREYRDGPPCNLLTFWYWVTISFTYVTDHFHSWSALGAL